MFKERAKKATVVNVTSVDQVNLENERTPKKPRTERGRRTMRSILDAAAKEFGANGFGETSIVSITQRAGVALGSFYTYFDSKEEVFRALVNDMSDRVKDHVAAAMKDDRDTMKRERSALESFLHFARENKEIYRIIDESEFADPASYHKHYQDTAERIYDRLKSGVDAGEINDTITEAHAWAIMGMNVFLGLRYGIWSEDKPAKDVADVAYEILSGGIGKS